MDKEKPENADADKDKYENMDAVTEKYGNTDIDMEKCEYEDDSDSQWTDISDPVTDEENDESGVPVCSATSVRTRSKFSFASTPVKEKETAANTSSLSEEEKQNYAFISEQLSILNKESSTVNTAIHQHQKKQTRKVTPSKCKADPQKTPRKQTSTSARAEIEHRKSVRKRLETTPPSTPRRHTVDVLDSGSADDADTSQDALQIDEQDIDETLERKAKKKGLTAINVKNIIHELVKNVDVQQMLRNHMNEQLSNMSGSEGLPFEPKMTRAKVKEVIEKGVPLQTWPLSPVKKTVVPKKPSILEIDFPDDEEDDEYSPDKDAEIQHESDDDLESMMSSHASDFGSPLPPTPSTPNIQTPLRARTPQTGDTETFRSPMSSTSGVSSRRPSLLGQSFKTSMAALEDASTQGSATQSDTIAKRTRSKLPLTDTSLTAIEEAFVAPDITPDMYDTECDDSEWQEFLRSLVKSDADPVEDDVNDPEFDFLEEAEKVEEVEEDFRFDRPFRVSKKELNQLITELDILFPDPEDEDKTLELEETALQESPGETTQKKSTSTLNKSELEENSLIVTPEERLLIEDQMRKHVQLTSQLFFLCKGSEDFEPMTTTCRQLLRELDIFRCVSVAKDMSSYNVYNLQDAMALVAEDEAWNLSQEHENASTYSMEDVNSNAADSDRESADGNKKIKPKVPPLLPSQIEVFWNSSVFMYPALLPRQRLLTQEEVKQCRLTYSKGEDNLIALAFEQFHNLKNCKSLMQSYLLPAKTTKQISVRMKNLRSKRTPDNALKYFIKYKKPLPRALVVEAFYPDQIKAPREQDDSVLPAWAKRKRMKERAACKKQEKKKKPTSRKRSSSLTLPLSSELPCGQGEEVEEGCSPAKKKPRSAPVSPTEDTNRRHVEDSYYRLPTKADKTIITPEGVFIPFKVLASTKPSEIISTLPQSSTSSVEQSQSLTKSIVESLGTLRGSIRIIPSTNPGEKPRIISSLIAVQGKPVQLPCAQELEDEEEESSQSKQSHQSVEDTDGEAHRNQGAEIDAQVENEMEAESFTSEGEAMGVTGQQKQTDAPDPTVQHQQMTVETSCNEEHKRTLESNIDDVDNVQHDGTCSNQSLQTNEVSAGEISFGDTGNQEQSCLSSIEQATQVIDQSTVPVTTESSETSCITDVSTANEINQPEAEQTSQRLESSTYNNSVIVESANNETHCGDAVEIVDNQEPNVEESETDRAAKQIMCELYPVSEVRCDILKETQVSVETQGVERTNTVCEGFSGPPVTGECNEESEIGADESSQVQVPHEHVQDDSVTFSQPSSSCVDHDMKDEDEHLHSNHSMTENLNGTECTVTVSDCIESVPCGSHKTSNQVFEIIGDSQAGSPENDPTLAQGDSDKQEQTSDVAMNSSIKPSNDVPVDEPDHVCVFPSTPPRGNTLRVSDASNTTEETSSTNLIKSVPASPQVTRTPLEIIAAFCPYYESPSSTFKPPTPKQSFLERTPPKQQSETVYCELRPKPPCSLNESNGNSPKPVSPFLTKVSSNSPKRVLSSNRTILPKGFVLDTKESPTKRAARSLKKRAKMICQRTSPCKLLPQTEYQRIERMQFSRITNIPKVTHSRRKQRKPVRKVLVHPSYRRSNSESDDLSETEDNKKCEDHPRGRAGTKRKLSDADKKQEESDGGQSEVEDAGMSQEDSQNEDEVDDTQTSDQNHLDMLMTASTTLGFGQKKSTRREKAKGKTQKKKEQTLAMLAPDLLEMDPKKDEKDTAFAQAYLDRVRESLKENLDIYEEFLTLMYNLGKEGQSAIEIYQKLETLFKDFPDLLDDFAGFLLPEQAVVCGCFMKNQETVKARTFIRKVEVNFEKQPNHFQKILKALSQWYQNPQRSPQDLQNTVKPLLRGMPHLLEEFSLFFPDEKPPESYMNDFETMTLSDSDFEEGASIDSFEEVEFPEGLDTYRTKWCACECHQDPNDVKQYKRLKHCFDCCLKVIDGKLYFQPGRNKLYPAKAIVHKAVSPNPGSKSATAVEIEEDQTADKENHIFLGGRPAVISPSASHTSPVRPKRIKLKISRKKAGQKRFLTLCEIGGSPTKQEPVDEEEPKDECLEESTDVAELEDISAVTTQNRLSPANTRRDSDALIVNPPVTLQADILQNERCDSDVPVVSCQGSPAMMTSFSSLSSPLATTSVVSVCSSIEKTVSINPLPPPTTLVPTSLGEPVGSVGASKLQGQTGGFVKISPTKGPSSPVVTLLSFGAGKSPSVSSASTSGELPKVGGAQISGGGATLTFGSNISALSGSSVTLTKQVKNSASAPAVSRNVKPIAPLNSMPVLSFKTVPSQARVSFPNLVPADAICHNDAITLNSGQQLTTQPTTSTTTVSSGSVHTVDPSSRSTDPMSLQGSGFGMSVLNILDGSSADASQSCMSDIIAKAMKSADINMSDAEISMSMDLMNSFLAANFKQPGSRNASPMKNSSVTANFAESQRVQNFPVSLQEQLVKAGIINIPAKQSNDDPVYTCKSGTDTIRANPEGTSQNCNQTEVLTKPTEERTAYVAKTLPQNMYTVSEHSDENASSFMGTRTETFQCVPVDTHVHQKKSLHGDSCVEIQTPSQTVDAGQKPDSGISSEKHPEMSSMKLVSHTDQLKARPVKMETTKTVFSKADTSATETVSNTDQMQAVASCKQTVSNTEQTLVPVEISQGQYVSHTSQSFTLISKPAENCPETFVQSEQAEAGQCGNGVHSQQLEHVEAVPVVEEVMEVDDDTEAEWTKDMDKICLEMCKEYGSVDETFAQIAEKLKVVTPNEVAARFEKLLQLLSSYAEMDEDSDDE